ncbi:MAG: zinc ribbon domain-containing protein [Clostridiales bacterium]|nr:zinc ribbon domain-containing protein [Clostridiales bacterium]
MAFCKNCGAELFENLSFCPTCGIDILPDDKTEIKTGPSPTPASPPDTEAPRQDERPYNNIPLYQQTFGQQDRSDFISPSSLSALSSEYKPISAWGYFGYSILFSLPLAGFILLLVFSFGGAKNYNLRNYARSFLIRLLLGIILLAAATVVLIALGFSFSEIGSEILENL